MKIKDFKNLFSIALVLTFCIGTILAIAPAANAQAPAPINIPTYAYLSVSPNPAGVNQPVNVIMWLDKYPPTASGEFGDRWHNFQVTVTAPDGTTTTLGPFPNSDPVGTGFTSFTPDKIGTYTSFSNSQDKS